MLHAFIYWVPEFLTDGRIPVGSTNHFSSAFYEPYPWVRLSLPQIWSITRYSSLATCVRCCLLSIYPRAGWLQCLGLIAVPTDSITSTSMSDSTDILALIRTNCAHSSWDHLKTLEKLRLLSASQVQSLATMSSSLLIRKDTSTMSLALEKWFYWESNPPKELKSPHH